MWLRRAQVVLVHLLCAAVLLGLGWLMWRSGGQFAETRETTAQLQILKAPFVYGMGVLCGVTGLVHLAMVREKPVNRLEGEGAAL
jgi:TRAP-type C4-dicarboxylate transport system permease small subunit